MKPEKKSWARALFAYAGGRKEKAGPVRRFVGIVGHIGAGAVLLHVWAAVSVRSRNGHIGPGLSSQCAQKSDRPLPRGQRKARDPVDLGLLKTILEYISAWRTEARDERP